MTQTFVKGHQSILQICLCLLRSLFITKGSWEPPRAATLRSLEKLTLFNPASIFLPVRYFTAAMTASRRARAQIKVFDDGE